VKIDTVTDLVGTLDQDLILYLWRIQEHELVPDAPVVASVHREESSHGTAGRSLARAFPAALRVTLSAGGRVGRFLSLVRVTVDKSRKNSTPVASQHVTAGEPGCSRFLPLPTASIGPQTTTLSADSYEAPGQFVTKDAVTPTGATGCDLLPFSPTLTATADGRTSAANGAGLRVEISQPLEQSNVKSVSVQPPKELTARGTTVAAACPEATFLADPSGCAGAQVGTVTASTPLLPDALAGPVYLVAHPTGLPTIEALLQGHKLSIDLSGTITFTATGLNSTFGAVPDAPITSFVLDLPPGPHSALASTTGVCSGPLTMPTTIIGQSGARIQQATPITVTDCPPKAPTLLKLKILRARVKGAVATLLVQVPRAGTLTARGKGLRKTSRKVTKAGKVTLKLRLSKSGRALRARRHRAHRKLNVPVTLHLGPLRASRTLVFK